MNSVRSLGRAITYEVARQVDVLSSGGTVIQETRHWDEDAGTTSTLRVKEATEDYRYFPDPDLVLVEPSGEWVEELRTSLPELPAQLRARLASQHGLGEEQIATLASTNLVGVFSDAVDAGAGAAEVANWLTNNVVGYAAEQGAEPAALPIDGAKLTELIALVNDGTLSTKLAREVLEDVLADKGTPKQIVADRGLEQLSDTDELGAIVDQVIAENEAAAQQVREGNSKAIGALVGGVMKATQGKANPQLVNQLIVERL